MAEFTPAASPSKPHPQFATPLPQSTRSDILEWRFPKPHHQHVLTGRSRAAWHTSFVIPTLNLLLDAGLCVNKLRPKHVFLTHGHNDHALLAPAFVKREDPPDIYCPASMKTAFDNFILADTMLNLGGLIGAEDAEKHGYAIDDKALKRSTEDGRSKSEAAFLNTHFTYGVRHGDVVSLRRVKGMTATVFDCDHTVPCVGYVFSNTIQKLRPELASLSGQEIQARRKAGEAVTAPQTTAMFAFLGDTTAATLAADPPWLCEGIPVVITECSFLYDEHKPQADKTKHTAWSDLEKVVRRWPRTTFVLMHFSLRYTDAMVVDFFRSMDDPPGNIVVWADPEAE